MPKSAKTKPSVDTVDADAVEASLKAKNIGGKIRRLRLKRSMGLIELGEQVGLSASFLSQLETGRVLPTMRNLARIALAFKKDFDYFLSEDEIEPLFRLSRGRDRIRLQFAEKEATILISDSLAILLQDRKTVPCIAELLPGGDSAAFHPHVFAGLELVYVIDGPLLLTTENKTELLQAEDSAWVDGNTGRQYKCQDDKPARAFIMTFESRA